MSESPAVQKRHDQDSRSLSNRKGNIRTALVGNPNSGKTAIFNVMTGLNQKVSNYPGITVEKKHGYCSLSSGQRIELIDLPGTYSLTPESFDERIVAEQFLHWIHGENPPDVIISVVDASNLNRNLYLTSQLTDLGIPVVIALNMMDRARRKDRRIDMSELKSRFGLAVVVPMTATNREGFDELKSAIIQAGHSPAPDSSSLPFAIPLKPAEQLLPVADFFEKSVGYSSRLAWAQALRLVARSSVYDLYASSTLNGARLNRDQLGDLNSLRETAIQNLNGEDLDPQSLEASLRYQWVDTQLEESRERILEALHGTSRSETVDNILTHRWSGPLIFVSLLYFIFQSIFTWATVPMHWIEAGFSALANGTLNIMPPGMVRSLLVEGVIGGVGSIMVFLPQILILVFFLTLMEDSGYMSRVAFMLDRFMTKIGLHGKSVLPLMSGYACAIPAVMATRTINSWKERLNTILIIPLMSCSARLPVYALMIGAFIPQKKVMGIFSLQGLTLIGMYFLGTGTAIIMAKIFSKYIKARGESSFVMELPPYRMPLMRSVIRQVYIRGKAFVTNAGKIILAISIVLWFLATFPRTDPGDMPANSNPIHTSFAGKIGHTIEPIIEPLGFDWKIGIGLITSFAAREVLVSTMATIYNVQESGEGAVNLTEAMRNDMNPQTGLPRYSPLVAISLMVFFVYAAQCMATFAIVKNETNSWKWPLFMMAYMTGLAYVASLVVYQGGQLLGFG